MSRGDLNYSIANYPRTVVGMIGEALPWTIGLLGLTTLFSFAAGTILGALLAWPRRAALDALADAAVMGVARHPVLSARAGADVPVRLQVPVAADLRRLQRRRQSGAGTGPSSSTCCATRCCRRLSIVLVSVGGWALAMRGMMVTTMGEDYVTFAEAKGLRSATIFTRYCMRNAILPQTTGLALALGQILSGAVLVEVIFGYPGIGALLFQAIEENDFFLIQGIVFTVIVALGFATFVLDVVYPWLDPRISYRAERRPASARAIFAATLSLAASGWLFLGILAVFIVVGALTVDTGNAQPLSVPALQPPSWDYPFGTDRQGRDLLAVMVAGTPLTLRIGFIAGFIGVGVGAVLAFTAAYYRGMVDTVIRSIADIGLTVPALLVLIIIAVSLKGSLTVNQMAIIVASLAWLSPTRTIRSQVLTLRERGYVEIARLNGMSGPEIIFRELMPNLLPYLAATWSAACPPRSWPRSGWKCWASARSRRRRSA